MKAVIITHGFGELRPGVERRVGECSFSLVYNGAAHLYQRRCNGLGENEAIVYDANLLVTPQPPVIAQPSLTNIVLGALSRPVIIGAGARAVIEACIPVDIVVLSGETIVDAIPTWRIKYTLYGEPDRGLIARYVRLDDCKGVRARLRISMSNVTNRSVLVKRIVFPAFMLDLCYRGEEIDAGVINVVITSTDTAAVQAGRVERAGCVKPPSIVKAPVFEKQRFVMLYGL